MDLTRLPKQLALEPKDANVGWLTNHNPRIELYCTGLWLGKPIVAWLVDGYALRTNVWQDGCEGWNHSRMPWVPWNEYWLDIANILEYKYNLMHETKEDRVLGGSSTDKTYDEAHSFHANPLEFIGRHSDPDVDLKELGWDIGSIPGSLSLMETLAHYVQRNMQTGFMQTMHL